MENMQTASLLWLTCILFLSGDVSSLRPHILYRNQQVESGYNYKTKYFAQTVDHFGFNNIDTYKQRYLVADQYWNPNGGPIFFYTGNEGDIAWFCNNTGFMWDIADEFKAMLVFAEHRYYGESIPYGAEAFKNPALLNYLTSEQALADFAVLIRFLKNTVPGATNSPVVSFGGSYGGMLSAWFRIKYPNIVVGALAGSAPIWQYTDLTPCEDFNRVLTNGFTKASKNCVENIRKSWSSIDNVAATSEGMAFISSTFKLCKPMSSQKDVQEFKSWLTNAWTDLAMVNYPYPANFLEPLPGWPVKVICDKLFIISEGRDLLSQLSQAVNIYFNYTGQLQCLNTSQDATGNLGEMGWDYQSCTEMVMPICSDGQSDMFQPSAWNLTQIKDTCFQKYNTVPQENWISTEYWGKNLKAASNIIFSNGDLDPWSSGGVLKTENPSLVTIIIPDGAHHLDLRAANPKDPPSVIAARKQEISIIKQWLAQASYYLN